MSRPRTAATGLAVVGAVLLAVSPFLSWADFRAPLGVSGSETGMDAGDGWITLALAAVAVVGIAFAVWRRPTGSPAFLWAAAGAAAAVVTGVEFATVRDRFGDVHRSIQGAVEDVIGVGADPVTKSFGVGLYVSAVGATLVLAAAVAWWVTRRPEG
jgi:hypothetical protein